MGISAEFCLLVKMQEAAVGSFAEVRVLAASFSHLHARAGRVSFGLWKIILPVESLRTCTCYAVAQSHNVAVQTHHDPKGLHSPN